jgi:serine/threonine-protein kinase RsbW
LLYVLVIKGYQQLKVLKKIQIEVTSTLDALDRILLQFEEIYQDFIPQQDWLQCRLAMAEGFTNAVRHAHKNLPEESTVKIEVLLTRTEIEIKIWDWGEAFDLHKFIAQTSRKHYNWLNSGRGIPLLVKIADRLEYRRLGSRNCLLIVKKLGKIEKKNQVITDE